MKDFHLRFSNPLRGLDERRLLSLLEEGERGSYASLQWLYRFIEKRNAAARAVKRRLLAALGSLDWSIRITDTDDPAEKAMAERQAETLRAAYDRLDNLRAALEHLALCELRGFAHVEKIRARTGDDPWAITELRPVEQWFWVRDGLYGDWQYNEGARSGVWQGKPIDQSQFIIREIDDPADEIIAISHVRQEVSDSDWDGYLERFGIPSTIVEGPPNVPADKEKEYQRAAERIASDSSGYIPNGAKVHTVAPGTGATVFLERLDYLDTKIVIAGTSGKLTILTESGSGTLAGGAQQDAFADLAQAIASKVSEAMQLGFDKPELTRKHRGEPILAYFEYSAVEEEDTAAHIDNAVKLGSAGYEIDLPELSEKTGYKITQKIPADGIPTPQKEIGQLPSARAEIPKPKIEGTLDVPSGPATVAAVGKELRVTPEFLAPGQSVFDELLAKAADGDVSDAELLASAEELLAALPALAAQTDSTGLADSLQAALLSAVEGTLTGSAA